MEIGDSEARKENLKIELASLSCIAGNLFQCMKRNISEKFIFFCFVNFSRFNLVYIS